MLRPTTAMKFGLAGLLALGAGGLGLTGAAHGKPGDEKQAEKKAEDGEKKGSRKAPRKRPSKEQARERLDALLKEHPEADVDKDGKLSSAEARDWTREHRPLPEGKRLEAFLKRNPGADKDQDGKLSREEFSAFLKASEGRDLPVARERLEKLLKEHPEADQDKDGKISAPELRQWRRDHPPAPRKKDAGTTPQKKTAEL